MIEAGGTPPPPPPPPFTGLVHTARIPIAERVAARRRGGVGRGTPVDPDMDLSVRRARPDHGESGTAYVLPIAGDARMTRAALRAVLGSTGRVRTAVLAAEILGPPRSLRPYGSDPTSAG